MLVLKVSMLVHVCVCCFVFVCLCACKCVGSSSALSLSLPPSSTNTFAAAAITEWYIQAGCTGLFVNCLSSEMYNVGQAHHRSRLRLPVDLWWLSCPVSFSHMSPCLPFFFLFPAPVFLATAADPHGANQNHASCQRQGRWAREGGCLRRAWLCHNRGARGRGE